MTDAAVGDREEDDHRRERNEDQEDEEATHDVDRFPGDVGDRAASRAGQPDLFSRSRISLPVLKNGTYFSRDRNLGLLCAGCGRCAPGGS